MDGVLAASFSVRAGGGKRDWDQWRKVRIYGKFCLQLLEADDGEVLDEALLDLQEPVMILVELLAGVGEEATVSELVGGCRIRIGGGRRPRDRSDPLELRKGLSKSVTN